MTIRMVFATVAFILAPIDAMAQHLLPFAPPLLPQRYTIEQTRPCGAKPCRFTIVRKLHFMKDGAHYRLRAILDRVVVDAPPEITASARAGLEPLRGIAVTFLIDAQGRMTGVENMPALWDRVRAGQRALLAAKTDAVGKAKARAMFNAINAMDEGKRVAILTGDVAPLLHFAESQPRGMIIDNAGTTGAFTETVEERGGKAITSYLIDAQTGLVRRAERQLTVPGAATPSMEVRVLEPDPTTRPF